MTPREDLALDGRLLALGPSDVPPGGAALVRWARRFAIDLPRVVVTVQTGFQLLRFSAVQLVDVHAFPDLGAGLRLDRAAMRDAGARALIEEAKRNAGLLAQRAAFAARRAQPTPAEVRTHVRRLEVALARLPPAHAPDDEPLFRYPDARVDFVKRPPSLHVAPREEVHPWVVDLDDARVRPAWRRELNVGPDVARAALACAIDALCDPEGAVLRAIEPWAAIPRWKHDLAALEGDLVARRPQPTASPPRSDRIAFRVVPEDGGVPRIVLQSARKGGGGFTAGRVVKSPEARRSGAPDALEAEIIDLCDALRGSEGALDRPLFLRLLDLLGRHPRVFLDGDASSPLRVTRLAPRLVTAPTGDTFRLELRVGPHAVARSARHGRFLAVAPPGTGILACAVLDEVSEAVLDALTPGDAAMPAEAIDSLFRTMRAYEARLDLELPPALRGEELIADARTLVRLALRAGDTLDASLRVRPWPGGPILVPGQGSPIVLGVKSDGGRCFAERDLERELSRARHVAAALGSGEPGGEDLTLVIDDPDRVCDAVAALAELEDEVEVEWEGQPLSVAATARPGALRLRVEKRRDWFGVEGGLDVEGEHVGLATMLQAIRDGRRFVRLKRGNLLAISRELRDRLRSADDLLVPDHGQLTIGAHGVERLAELVDDETQLDAAREWVALRTRWRAARAFEPALPEGLRAELRPYQLAGYQWLARLAACGVAGCLADDMGLGKTVQALALLLSRAAEGPALVVAPTSVGANWESEAARFAPGLRVIAYRGGSRAEALADLRPGDVLVTSYDLVVRDVEPLAAVRFATLVFDEAQSMKNAASKRAAAARRLDADFRLALTGTPVENHLGELWSLYRALMPSLFGGWERFRERFAGPIERDRDPERRVALSAMVRPYLLRRTKDEVAPELPPRTEIVRVVELSAEERALYEAERRAAVEALAARGAAAGKPKEDARFAVFSALLRLRQLACHPRLRNPESQVASSKLASAVELLEELKDAKHRALVFSQFTSHLALVAEALRARGFTLLELDGSTPAEARADRVRRFQRGEADVFLISLKAGGTGLNLTAADYVLHLDPWWNPAAEDQASDRAHRIGQDKPVTVVRLIARDTIEETVLALHADKRELADAVLSGGDGGAKLSTADLVALMERGEAPASAKVVVAALDPSPRRPKRARR